MKEKEKSATFIHKITEKATTTTIKNKKQIIQMLNDIIIIIIIIIIQCYKGMHIKRTHIYTYIKLFLLFQCSSRTLIYHLLFSLLLLSRFVYIILIPRTHISLHIHIQHHRISKIFEIGSQPYKAFGAVLRNLLLSRAQLRQKQQEQ